jgi:hypothetical protein
MAVGPSGDLFFGVTAGQVRRVPAQRAASATGLRLPDTGLVGRPPAAAGVEATPGGTLYVAVNAEGGPTGVWSVPLDGGDPTPYATVPVPQGGGFVNDVLYDEGHRRLLVTESFAGVVYEVPVGDRGVPVRNAEATPWLDADVLDTESFGANGLTRREDGDVFVSVTRATAGDGTDVGRLVRVPVGDDGSAGGPELVLESPEIFGADGITARGQQVYVACNSRNRVVRVTPSGEPVVVADAEDGLVFPSDVVFGAADGGGSGDENGGGGGSGDENGGGGGGGDEDGGGEGDADGEGDAGDDDGNPPLFVCNFASQTPEKAGILRTHP